MRRSIPACLAFLLAASACSSGMADDGLWEKLLSLSRRDSLGEKHETQNELKAAQIQLGTWYCTGPFRDKLFAVVTNEFQTVFAPEKDVLAAGAAAADLSNISFLYTAIYAYFNVRLYIMEFSYLIEDFRYIFAAVESGMD